MGIQHAMTVRSLAVYSYNSLLATRRFAIEQMIIDINGRPI